MYYNTIIIRKLLANEITYLREELTMNDLMWHDHATNLNLTALQDGKSIHLQWCNDRLNIITDNWKVFPQTHQLLKSIVSNSCLGRVYWHRLLPGDTINPHTDANIPFVKSNVLQHRYQIYLDIDIDHQIVFDNKPVNGSDITNSIIDFPLRTMHHYTNNSASPLYLLVFDDIGTPP